VRLYCKVWRIGRIRDTRRSKCSKKTSSQCHSNHHNSHTRRASNWTRASAMKDWNGLWRFRLCSRLYRIFFVSFFPTAHTPSTEVQAENTIIAVLLKIQSCSKLRWDDGKYSPVYLQENILINFKCHNFKIYNCRSNFTLWSQLKAIFLNSVKTNSTYTPSCSTIKKGHIMG